MQAKVSLSGAIAKLHQIATGREITIEEAIDYFHDPARLREVLERSGSVRDPRKRLQIATLLDRDTAEIPLSTGRCA